MQKHCLSPNMASYFVVSIKEQSLFHTSCFHVRTMGKYDFLHCVMSVSKKHSVDNMSLYVLLPVLAIQDSNITDYKILITKEKPYDWFIVFKHWSPGLCRLFIGDL